MPALKTLAAAMAAGLGGLALSGCAFVQEKTLGESLDSASAGTQIKAKLLSEGGISQFGEADVVVEDRLALLVGRVPSESARQEAERIAWTVNTIDEVANELVVDERNIMRDINDPWIASQVRARLLGDSQIKAFNYNIHVYNGVVYLLGFARSDDELRRAAEQASVVKGVKKVISYVKQRERGVAPSGAPSGAPETSVAAVQPVAPQLSAVQPAPIDPDIQAPAPVVASAPPAQRGGVYSDPYAAPAQPTPQPAPSAPATSAPIDLTAPNAGNDLESTPLQPIGPDEFQ